MRTFEYKVIPAPDRSPKMKGTRDPSVRFAQTMEAILNELGADGWQFWRAEDLPSEERSGLTGTKTIQHNLLIFRRPVVAETQNAEPAFVPFEQRAEPQTPPAVPPVGPASRTAPEEAARNAAAALSVQRNSKDELAD